MMYSKGCFNDINSISWVALCDIEGTIADVKILRKTIAKKFKIPDSVVDKKYFFFDYKLYPEIAQKYHLLWTKFARKFTGNPDKVLSEAIDVFYVSGIPIKFYSKIRRWLRINEFPYDKNLNLYPEDNSNLSLYDWKARFIYTIRKRYPKAVLIVFTDVQEELEKMMNNTPEIGIYVKSPYLPMNSPVFNKSNVYKVNSWFEIRKIIDIQIKKCDD